MDRFAAAIREEAFRSLVAGDLAGYGLSCQALADLYEESGRDGRAAHRRLRAQTARTPGCRWPRAEDVPGLSDHQRRQLSLGLRCPVAVLTGTPGTGKTYTAAAVVKAIGDRHGLGNLAVCAPTGKAAVRVTAGLQRSGVPLAARTVHSLLEIGRNGHDGAGWGFRRDATRPLPQRFVIVDEASMLDTALFASLLDACAPGTHLLLVGDPHQLPPVGHGAPLRDLLAAGVPAARLSEIRRNAGLIVEACAAIKDGRRFAAAPWPAKGRGEAASGNLLVRGSPTADDQVLLSWLLATLTDDLPRLAADGGLSPLWDVQVIVATNGAGPLSRKAVNAALQARLNPDGRQVAGNPWRTGDKVICLRNGWYELERIPGVGGGGEEEDGEVYVANGEIGGVMDVRPRSATVEFLQPQRRVRVAVPSSSSSSRRQGEGGEDDGGDGGDGCGAFDLAYAITCHKAQGSEWPVVLVLLDKGFGARQVCSREWLYTAISRASQACVLIGNEGVAQQMVRRTALQKRKTFLRELLTRREEA